MPELPEVETIKNELSPHVIGHSITGITIFWERMVTQPAPDQFQAGVIGHKITDLTRRGKYLFFHLGSGRVLVIHLRMTGSLLVKPASAPVGRFVRAIIHLDGETAIHFRARPPLPVPSCDTQLACRNDEAFSASLVFTTRPLDSSPICSC